MLHARSWIRTRCCPRPPGRRPSAWAGALLSLCLSLPLAVAAQDSRLTYQGHLEDGGAPADGAYDLLFLLQDTAGNTIGSPLAREDVVVTGGVFTVTLDFGASAFDGSERYLQVQVRAGDSAGAHTALVPRSPVTPVPHAQVADSAAFAASVADDSIGSLNVANGSIGAADIDQATVQRRVSGACPDGQAIQAIDASGAVGCESGLQGPVGPQGPQGAPGSADAWSRSGNAFTSASSNFLGTTDNQALEIRVFDERALRIEPTVVNGKTSPNLIGGSFANTVAAGVQGATIGGGGNRPGPGLPPAHSISDHFGTIGGGQYNQAGDAAGTPSDASHATVAGGQRNIASGNESVIGGGYSNEASGERSTVAGGAYHDATAEWSSIGGGSSNEAGGVASTVAGGFSNEAGNIHDSVGGGRDNLADGGHATVAGGLENVAGDQHATVAGGSVNWANSLWATVLGGNQNTAAGYGSTVVGGRANCAGGTFSVALGYRAKVRVDEFEPADRSGAGCDGVASSGDGSGDEGTFVFADSQEANFTSTGPDQFNVRAKGGFRLHPSTDVFFGTTGRQMLNLYSDTYGIGVQTSTFYQRSNSRFAWFRGGSHVDAVSDPGAGGDLLMTLHESGSTTVGTPTGIARAQTFTNVSDRNAKIGFAAVDVAEVLSRVLAMPVTRWSYRNAPHQQHMGPVAQDFRAAFGLGENDTTIATVDADGVALAAIQGLNAKLEQENASLRRDLRGLAAELAELRALVAPVLAEGREH